MPFCLDFFTPDTMKLVLVHGYLHPVTSADHTILTDAGYSGTRIPEGALPALLQTVFKGKILKKNIETFALDDVLTDLVVRWAASVPYVKFRYAPEPKLLLSDEGLKCAILTTTADGNVHMAEFETRLGSLRHYLGRYGHTLTTTYEDQPAARVYTLRIAYSSTLTCVHFYTDLKAPLQKRVWSLSPSFRMILEIETVAGNKFFSVKSEELVGATWHAVSHRSFPYTRLDKSDLSDVGAFLIALGAN